MIKEYYETKGNSTYEIVRNCKAYKEYILPNISSYIQEDILYGLVPLVSICDLLKIPPATAKRLIYLWFLIDSVNYWQKGLTIDKLGWDDMNCEGIL